MNILDFQKRQGYPMAQIQHSWVGDAVTLSFCHTEAANVGDAVITLNSPRMGLVNGRIEEIIDVKPSKGKHKKPAQVYKAVVRLRPITDADIKFYDTHKRLPS